MEKFILRLYRHLPKQVRQLITPRVRDVILGGLTYIDAKPDWESLKAQKSAVEAERGGDWRSAVQQWQMILALSASKGASEATKEETGKRSTFARNRLRTARLNYALELHQRGNYRAFSELCCRIAESMPDQRIMKNDPALLNLMRLYVQTALKLDGVDCALPKTGPLKRVVFCLDVMKLSKVHTHARVIFSISRNLLRFDPNIEIHLVITGERYVVPTPITATSFVPLHQTELEMRARGAFGSEFGKRFHLHVRRSSGLEAVIETCKFVISLQPDVMLYGGGHKGMFSNESRLVRHSLFDHLPTAFFYIQSNNEVDEKIDTIIARGPHTILGPHDPQDVHIQPYPTMEPDATPAPTRIDPSKFHAKTIVSAIAGVRMTQKMSEISDRSQKEIFALLEQAPGAVWHLIGAGDPDELLRRNAVIRRYVKSGRIVVHPVLPMAEFTALVEGASLFYHMPGFTGGSGGASVARRAGIPIITFSHSDVAGRQPASTVFENDQVGQSLDMAARVLNDLEAWTQVVEQQIKHTEWIRETAAAGFHGCLEHTVAKAQDRLKAAQSPDTAPPAP